MGECNGNAANNDRRKKGGLLIRTCTKKRSPTSSRVTAFVYHRGSPKLQSPVCSNLALHTSTGRITFNLLSRPSFVFKTTRPTNPIQRRRRPAIPATQRNWRCGLRSSAAPRSTSTPNSRGATSRPRTSGTSSPTRLESLPTWVECACAVGPPPIPTTTPMTPTKRRRRRNPPVTG